MTFSQGKTRSSLQSRNLYILLSMGASVYRAATPSGLAARQLSKQTVVHTLTLLIAARALA